MRLKDQLTLPTVNDAIAVRPLSLPVPPGTTERRNLRTERSKTFAHAEKAPDGKEIRTCKAQIGAVCYRDDTGELRSIDTTIRDLGTHVGVEWAPYKFKLHESGIGFDFESREGGQCTVTLTGIGGEKFTDSIKPEVADNTITFRDVRPGCDIVFKCLNERVKTLRILRDDKAPRTFDWAVTSDKPELIDSTLRGTDVAGNELELSSELDGDVIRETWTGKTKVILDPATRIKSLSDEVSYPVEIDPTANVSVSADADDGYEVETNSTWGSTNSSMYFGFGGGTKKNIGWRFQSVAVPQGATITDASITFKVNGSFGDAGGKLWGELVANSSVFNSTRRPSVVSKTNANTTVATISSTGSKTESVTAIIQEIVNQATWASGNALNIPFLTSETSGTHTCTIEDWHHAGTAQASISITYTTPESSGGTAANLLLLGCG